MKPACLDNHSLRRYSDSMNPLRLHPVAHSVVAVLRGPGPIVHSQESGEIHRGSCLFFRAGGAQSGGPVFPKTRSTWTRDKRARTASQFEYDG